MAGGLNVQNICALQRRIEIFLTLQGLYNKILDHPATLNGL